MVACMEPLAPGVVGGLVLKTQAVPRVKKVDALDVPKYVARASRVQASKTVTR